ncbi:MAG: CvpA family protein [Verrucomicrobiota bacterium]
MIIWIIAALCIVATVVLGYTQGAVKGIVSTVGLMIAAAICVPGGAILQPMLNKIGFANPLIPIFIAPVLVLAGAMVVVKVIANAVHHQVETHYKYKEPELRMTLWKRTNERFGLAVALVSALVYTTLIATLIYVMGYPALLLSNSEDPSNMRYLVMAAESLKDTKMHKVAAAFDPAPKKYYQYCDIIGLVHQNPMLWGRLTSYPPLLVFGERDEFQAIGSDQQVSRLLMEQPPKPIGELLADPKIQGVMTNADLVKQLFDEFLKLDYEDLTNYLWTGKSPKFEEEKILGRWTVNQGASLKAMQRANPKYPAQTWGAFRQAFDKSEFRCTAVGLVDKQFVVRTYFGHPSVQPGAPPEPPVMKVDKGTWNNIGTGKYELSDAGGNKVMISIDGDRFQMETKMEMPAKAAPQFKWVIVFDHDD